MTTLHSACICDISNGDVICDHINDCLHSDDIQCGNCFCEAKIVSKGQFLCFGNIQFLDYCEKHMKTCNSCKTYDIKYMIDTNTFFCEACYKIS